MAVASKNIPAPDLVASAARCFRYRTRPVWSSLPRPSKAGIELVSTGGTARAIAAADMPVRDVSE